MKIEIWAFFDSKKTISKQIPIILADGQFR